MGGGRRTDRRTDRGADRQMGRQMDRQKDRKRGRQAGRCAGGVADRRLHKERDRCGHKHSESARGAMSDYSRRNQLAFHGKTKTV